MNTKLTVALLASLSVCLSISAYALADGDPSDDVNWSYVMAGDTADYDAGSVSAKSSLSANSYSREKLTSENETVIAKTAREGQGEALTLTYVDEAAPIPQKTASLRAFKTCRGSCLSDPIPVQDLKPETVARNSIVESQIDTQYVQQPVKVQYPITRQYPISVQYPVTVQREITIEQPVVMEQPVIVKRPVVMQQAITVQRKPTYVQQQPMVMQQQPTYIQQRPIVMQAPAIQQLSPTVVQQPVMMTQQPIYQTVPSSGTQPLSMSAPASVYSAPLQSGASSQMVPSSVSTTVSTQAYVPQSQVSHPTSIQPLMNQPGVQRSAQMPVSGQVYVPVQNGQPVYQQPLQQQIGYGYRPY